MRIRFLATVLSVEERWDNVYAGGIGKDATFTKQPLGWWMRLSGLRDSVFVGFDQPRFYRGQQVSLTIEST